MKERNIYITGTDEAINIMHVIKDNCFYYQVSTDFLISRSNDIQTRQLKERTNKRKHWLDLGSFFACISWTPLFLIHARKVRCFFYVGAKSQEWFECF